MHDIASRYRGSVLGPFWITVTTAAMIVGVGLMYSQLLNTSLHDYIPWLATGVVFWTLFSQMLIEGCDAFVSSATIIKQTALPMLSFIARMITRNLISFAHQAVIVVVVLVWFDLWRKANVPLSLLGLVLVLVNLSWLSLVTGIISARFRDVPPIIGALVQIAMFLTPVFWRPETIKAHRFILDWNPFYHMLEVTRRPLLGEPVKSASYIILIAAGVLGWALAFAVFSRTRRRVVHYL